MFLTTLHATYDTLWMIGISALAAVIFGLPLGVCLYQLKSNRFYFGILNVGINMIRALPFIILMLVITPVTRALIGTAIGTTAACVPLGLAAIAIFARLTCDILSELPSGLKEAAVAMGSTPYQTLRHWLWPQARPAFIQSLTFLLIQLVGYSAMAGAIGGGGLGSHAIFYGYQRYDSQVMLVTALILITLVELIQRVGDKLADHFSH